MAFRSDVENPLLCMHDILFLENLRSLWRVILDYNVFLKNKDIASKNLKSHEVKKSIFW